MKSRGTGSTNDAPSSSSSQRHDPLPPILLVALFLTIIYTIITIQTFSSIPSLSPSSSSKTYYRASFSPNDPGFEVIARFQKQQQEEEEKKKKKKETLFPQSIQREEFEEINHPGAQLKSETIIMKVPPFWDPSDYEEAGGIRNFLGNHGERLMTKEEALSIGSTVPLPPPDEEDETTDKDDTTTSKTLLETIFVAISSYRDDECPNTIHSIFSRATYPQRIRVAVVDQIDSEDIKCSQPRTPCQDDPTHALCLYSDQIDFYEMDATLAVGPVFARHIGHRMYRGEYFAMQCDAHVSFIQDWDVDVIEQWRSANNEMAVLSVYLSDMSSYDEKTGLSLTKARPIMCNSDYEGRGRNRHLRHMQQPEGVPVIHEPVIEPFWAAGFSFSRGHFVVNVPYDQHLPMVFQGEEISMGLRGFTYGYDYYANSHSVCFHMYAVGKNTEKRHKVPLFWEHTTLYEGVGGDAMARLNGIIHMNPNEDSSSWSHVDELKYGIGKVRTLQKFFDTFGLHVKEQTVEHHLCRFVGRPMQKKFIPFLRENGMGIDYDKIDYKFVDPDHEDEE